jgi:hypothetical protein
LKVATPLRAHLAFIGFAVSGVLVAACSKETDVGAPCQQSAPCVDGGVCGFELGQTYLEEKSQSCEQACIVHRLDNGTKGSIPANPEVTCDAKGEPQGCLTQAQLEQGSYCTCPCDGAKSRDHYCECPSGFACTQALQGRDSFCVRTP